MLHDALDLCTDGPAAIRYPKTMPLDPADPELGVCGEGLRRPQAPRVRHLPDRGRQMLAAARDAADRLAAEGHDVTLWDPGWSSRSTRRCSPTRRLTDW